MTIMILVLSAHLGLAQQPRPVQRRPIERPLLKRNALVVDIRSATSALAKVRDVKGSRVAIAPPVPGMVAQALTVAQLQATLHEAGLKDVLPQAEYARFTPTQLSVEGKGYALFEAPLWVDPSQVQFDTSFDDNVYLHIMSGPKIALKEAGAFVLDFLIKIQGSQPGTAYRCDVIKGEDVFQSLALTQETQEPQHLLVVFQQGLSAPPVPNPWVGIRIHGSGQTTPPDWIRWTLYQVVVTKL
jgi:hypothetical protein